MLPIQLWTHQHQLNQNSDIHKMRTFIDHKQMSRQPLYVNVHLTGGGDVATET